MSRPTEILIDRAALLSNCALAKSLSPENNLMAVVKADAYGHGVNAIAQTLEHHVDMFAVSCVEEAMELRKAGIGKPVLLLEGCFSADELVLICEQNMQLVVHNEQQVKMLESYPLSSPVTLWLKIDTGMHRLGIAEQDAEACFKRLKKIPQVKNIVLTTHLASADCLDGSYTEMQLQRFFRTIDGWGAKCQKSIANSAALLHWSESRSDWNRPGIMLYGINPFEQNVGQTSSLIPVMSFKSQVIAVRKIDKGESVGYGNTWTAQRPSVIATVAVGYGDGYPRTAKSGTPVLVKGQRAELAGRVSMDMISLDVTDITDVQIGDEVELWGQHLHASEVAKWSQTIGYELVTRMPKRTKRRIVN